MRKAQFVSGAFQEVANRVAMAQGNQPRKWEKFNTLSFYTVADSGVKLLADWIYVSDSHRNVVVHVAAYSRLWARPELLYHVFAYPFLQARYTRITAPIAESNLAACRAAEALGFILEGRLRKAEPGGDLLMYGMLREECRWLLQETANALAA